MKKYIISLALVLATFSSYCATFTATTSGSWNLGTTWGGVCGGGCVAGVDYPAAADDAIIPNGISVTVPPGGIQCRNLQLDPNTASSVNIALPFASLTINGTLLGYDAFTGFPSPPVVAGIIGGAGQLIFTGSNMGGLSGFGIFNEVIAYWNTNSPIPTCRFEFGVNTRNIDWIYTPAFSPTAIEFSRNVTINSGTLQFGTNAITEFTMPNASATLTVASGATFLISIPATGDGTPASKINTVIINGTCTQGDADSYLNSEIFTLGSSAVLNVGFSGADQTEGWWYQSTSPAGTITINPSSTVVFNANASQNLPANVYGNLILDAPVSSVTKTLIGSGSFSVAGAFTINTGNVTFTSINNNQASFQGTVINNGIWTTISNQDIRFNGSSAQTIGGSSAITFNDNVIFANSLGVDFDVDVIFASTITDNNNPITFSQDFIFSGATYNQGSGVLTFDGDPQQIAGSGDINFEDITLSSAVLSVNATNASLSGLLSMTNSTFDADGSGSGSFTLVSDANGTASVGNLTGSSVSGNWTVQRFFDGSGDVWRNFGTAVSGATVSNITTSGFTINGNDLAHYDETETALGGIDDGWVLQSAFGSSLSNSRGYSMWTRDTEMTNIVDFVGTLNTGNRNMTVFRTGTGTSANDGWNLVNNPFASTIDWDLVTASNLDGFASVWDGTQYLTVGSGGDISTGFIASGQSFWVHSSSGTPSLTITEADKVASSAIFQRNEAEEFENRLIVSLSDSGYTDRTYIWFRSGASDQWDSKHDALKQSNNIFNLSSFSSFGEDLAINSMGSLDTDKAVYLNITNILEGTYELSFAEVSSFDIEITLIDHFLGKEEVLKNGYVYDFTVTSDTLSYGSERFEVIFGEEQIITAITTEGLTDTIRLFPNPVGDQELTIEAVDLSSYQSMLMYNSQGKLITTLTIDSDNEIRIDMSRFHKGVYFIHLTGEKGSAVHKILKN